MLGQRFPRHHGQIWSFFYPKFLNGSPNTSLGSVRKIFRQLSSQKHKKDPFKKVPSKLVYVKFFPGISANEFHQKKSIRKMLWKSPRSGWSFRIIDNGLIYLFSDLFSIDTVYLYIHICLYIYIYMRWLVVWNISHFSRPQLLELREPPEVQIFLEFSFELCWE